MKREKVTINRKSLISQIARTTIGERTFSDFSSLSTGSGSGGGLANKIFNGLFKFGGFLLKGAFSFIEWSFSGLWEVILDISYEIAYFDWSQSDEDIKNEIRQNNQTIFRQIGQLLGSGTIWLSSIAVSSALTIKFPVVAGRVALALAEDGNATLRGQLTNTLAITTQTTIRSLLLGSYLWYRKLSNQQPTSKNKKPWILAEKIEEKVQQIPNNSLRNFTQGFLDGAFDSIIDIGYVISFTLDDHFASMREALDNDQPTRTIEILPNSQSDEVITIENSQDEIISTVDNYVATHSLVSNRDIGTVVGQPYDDWYSTKPQGRKITLLFNARERPPFVDAQGKKTKRVEISIPDVKQSVSWNDLKAIRPFTWGNYLAKGIFENRRQMFVYGASESEAKNTLLELSRLSTKELIQITVSHPEMQNIARKKRPTKVFPVGAVFLIRKSTIGQGSTTLIDGQNRAVARKKVDLWKDDPPLNFPFSVQ